MKEGRLGGIEVFGLAIAEEATAKADDPTPAVPDREEDAVAKAVVVLAVLLDHQASLDQMPQVLFGAPQLTDEEIPPRGGVAEAEAGGDLAAQSASLEVVNRTHGLGVLAQLPLVELGGRFEQGVEGASVGAFGSGFILLRYRQTGSTGQFLHGVTEFLPFEFHEKTDGGAMGATAETVVELLIGADGKGGRLLVVEGATGLKVLTGLA